MHEKTNTMHTCTLRVNPLVALKNGPCLHVECLWRNKNESNDHSPSMTLSKLPKQNDHSPSRKLPKTLGIIAFMVYTMTRARPVYILTQGCSLNTMVKQHC